MLKPFLMQRDRDTHRDRQIDRQKDIERESGAELRCGVVNTSAVAHDFTVNFLAELMQVLLPTGPTHHPVAMVTLSDICRGGS